MDNLPHFFKLKVFQTGPWKNARIALDRGLRKAFKKVRPDKPEDPFAAAMKRAQEKQHRRFWSAEAKFGKSMADEHTVLTERESQHIVDGPLMVGISIAAVFFGGALVWFTIDCALLDRYFRCKAEVADHNYMKVVNMPRPTSTSA